jgi:hypothetical protein
MRLTAIGLSLVVSAAIAACGGGGATEPSGFNVDAAFTELFTRGASFPDLQSAISNTPILVNESHTYQPTGPQSATHTRVTTTSADPMPRTDSETIQFTLTPLTISTITNAAGTAHYRQVAPLPTAAQVGSAGTYAETTDETAVTRLDWAREAAAGETTWACLNSTILSANFTSVRTCLNIDRQGNILKARYDYRVPIGDYTVQ